VPNPVTGEWAGGRDEFSLDTGSSAFFVSGLRLQGFAG